MSYTLYDYTESLVRVSVNTEDVESVVRAWGESIEGYGEWSGGFLLKLKSGQYAYVRGWCDTTGWGCQDGAEIDHFDSEPASEMLIALDNKPHDWDEQPTDLNKWHQDGCPEDAKWA